MFYPACFWYITSKKLYCEFDLHFTKRIAVIPPLFHKSNHILYARSQHACKIRVLFLKWEER